MNYTEEKAIWKTYPDYPFLQANQFGEIRTIDRYVPSKNGSKRLVEGRVLKQQLNKSGYMYVEFHTNGKQVYLRVQRVVATCFIPNPHGYPEVNHKDNDRTNNSVDNLEWCTSQYNHDYKKNFGTSPAQVQGQPVIAVNLDSFEVFWFESQHEAGRKLGVDYRNVNSVIKGKRYTNGGYWFTNADLNAAEKTRAKFGDKVAEKVEKLMLEHL